MVLVDGRLISQSETGISRYTKELVRFYQERYGARNVGIIVNQENEFGESPVFRTRLRPFSLPDIFRFSLWLRRIDYSFLHSPFYSSVLFRTAGKVHVSTVHDLMYRIVPRYLSSNPLINAIGVMYFNIIVSLNIRNSDFVLSVSEKTTSDVRSIYSAEVHTVLEGVNRLEHAQAKTTSLPEGIQTDEYFLYVGNARPHKNLRFLLDTYHKARTSKSLVIVGNRVANEGRVRFLGRVNDEVLAALYRNCSAFVFPSIYEGFGLPVLEALDQGCRVFCSTGGALAEFSPEFVHHFSPTSSEELTGLLESCDSFEKPTGSELRAYLQRYSWERHGNVLGQLLDRKGL